jgi:hypothetical protein
MLTGFANQQLEPGTPPEITYGHHRAGSHEELTTVE